MTFFHPSAARLDAFTEADGGNGDPGRVATHLESCQRCRNEVAFRRELRGKVAHLPVPDLPAGILDRVLRDRADGQRVILPVDQEGTSSASPVAYRVAAIVLIAAAGLGVSYVALNRGSAKSSADSAGEQGLGELWSATVFFPGVAAAGERPGKPELLQAVAPQIDGTRMRDRSARYQRRYVDSTGKSTLGGQGTVDIRLTKVDGNPAWTFKRDWVEYANKLPGSRLTHENETMLLEHRTLRLIQRDVDAFPYGRYSRITVAQHFDGDSVYGKMMSQGGDSRGIGRTFLRRLPSDAAPYISDAFAPLFFTSIRITPGWRGRISVLGWAVRDNDVFYPIELRNLGREKVTVPAGTFDCWHFLITSGPRRYDFWARVSDGLAIRSRNESTRATLGISNIDLVSESH
jgi:hypothetical protein